MLYTAVHESIMAEMGDSKEAMVPINDGLFSKVRRSKIPAVVTNYLPSFLQ